MTESRRRSGSGRSPSQCSCTVLRPGYREGRGSRARGRPARARRRRLHVGRRGRRGRDLGNRGARRPRRDRGGRRRRAALFRSDAPKELTAAIDDAAGSARGIRAPGNSRSTYLLAKHGDEGAADAQRLDAVTAACPLPRLAAVDHDSGTPTLHTQDPWPLRAIPHRHSPRPPRQARTQPDQLGPSQERLLPVAADSGAARGDRAIAHDDIRDPASSAIVTNGARIRRLPLGRGAGPCSPLGALHSVRRRRRDSGRIVKGPAAWGARELRKVAVSQRPV